MADAERKTMEIGYWSIRGLQQPVRMACALGDVEYIDKQYACEAAADGEGWDLSAWTDVKHKLGMDIPNLPYLIETDGSSFSESQAILTYVCEKGGLTKDYTVFEKHQALALALEVQDIRNKAVGLFYGSWDGNWDEQDENGKYVGANGKFAAKAKTQFERLEKIMAKREKPEGGLISRPGFCAADIHLAEMVYQHQLMRPQILADCPTLKQFTKAFFAQDKVAKIEADCKLAINNKMAKWGNEYMEGPTF